MSWQLFLFYTLILGGGIAALQLSIPGLLLMADYLTFMGIEVIKGIVVIANADADQT